MHIEKDISYNDGGDPSFQFYIEEGLYDMTLRFRSPSTLQGDSVDVEVFKEDGDYIKIVERKPFQEQYMYIPFRLLIKKRHETVVLKYRIHRSIYYSEDPVQGRVRLSAKEIF